MTNLFDRMKLFVQRDKEFRSALYDIMGFFPHNVELYRIAFAHKSQEYKSKKTGDRPLNNERLEFLGDAVLETVVSDIVYHHFKNKREGFLTNTRSKIVSRESLGKLAKDLGIDRLIQSHTNSKAHNSFLAGNAFEALMGAIYLDRGFDYAFRFIEHRIMGSLLDLEGVAHKEVNFKSKLLEWSQKNRIRMEFKDKQTSNSGNQPAFATTIILEGLFAGDGKGFSKKEAHQNAAKDALTRMRREPKFIDDVFSSKEKRTAMEADPCFTLPVIDEIEADLAREAEEKTEQSKREGRNKREQKPKKAEPKKEQPKTESKKEQPKAEPKKEQPKTEPKKEQPKEAVEPARETVAKAAPVVLPIAFEDIDEEKAPIAENPVDEQPREEEKTHVAEVVAEKPEAVLEPAEVQSAPASQDDIAEAPEAAASDEEAAPAEEAHAKKARRRGRRQNAAGFTNTATIPAETSHRAEKAAKKVEEAKKEKARKVAKKTARQAAKGIDIDAEPAPAEAPVKKQEAPTAGAPADAATAPAKKPRRRRKTKAELPAETPNPERESAISAAEEAAYRQTDTED